MIDNLFTVFQQVLILFLLMGAGYIFNKAKVLDKNSCKKLSDIVVTYVAPCVIIKSFIRDYDASMMKMLFLALAFSALLHVFMIVSSKLVIRISDDKKRRVAVYATVFSNAGFVALPLQEAILGGDGVFYGAAYIVIFNIAMWSFGVVEMSGDKSMVTPKKLLVSPGIIGVVVGVIVFAFSIKPPFVVTSVLSYMSALNVPLPMFVIGYHLAETDILHAFKEKDLYFSLVLRMIVYPLAAILILKLLNVESVLAIALAIAVSSPVGATVSMFSEKFGSDTEFSVKLVSVSTLISIITMPLLIAFAQMIF